MNLDELLLTHEEAEAAVNKWIDDYAGRIYGDYYIHWKDIVLVIAKAQIEKIKNSGVTLAVISRERPEAPAIE